MRGANPYRPGAGFMPLYLAGRDSDVKQMELLFDSLNLNIPTQSVIFSGLRGVGKTVLINTLQKNAEEKGIFCKHIEVETRNDFISQIATCSKMFLRSVSSTGKIKNLIEKSLDAVKSLVISFDPSDNTFSLSVQEAELYKSTNLTQSLTEVFTSIGEIAYKTQHPICFFIDEIQYMESDQLGSLIAAVHRTNQLGYPVMIVGAGLPKIYKMLAEEKTYSERLFIYKEVGSLTAEFAKEAITEPVRRTGMMYANDAIDKIIDVTKGYPFFIQQLCKIIYENAENDLITLKDVENAIPTFFETLDNGFFKLRYARCSDNEKKFIFAMVQCGELPCTITNISKNLGKGGKSISPTRGQLISKGIIYPVKHGELDFTVPEFAGFIQRQEGYQSWIAVK